MLDSTFHWTGTKLGVIASLSQEVDGLISKLQRHAVALQHVRYTVNLQTYNLLDFRLRQRQEHDGLVNTVQKLGADALLQQVHHFALRLLDQGRLVAAVQLLHLTLDVAATHVRGHDDDGILEVDCAAFVIRQSAIIEYLQQDVEDVRVCLLNLIKQYHRVGLAAYGLGQLTAFIVTYISRRRSDQTRYAVLLLILTHVDTRHHRFVIKEELCQGFGQFGLTHTRCTKEEERTDWPLRVLQSGAATAYSIGYRFYGLILSDNPLVQFGL